eukprot:TRINITY_DN121244_c0_g1_i1.p1 TRINITY_DN121244_c0_g1~~TRINITY_DN121244_c0_g1_i1.p1  ORF type:complete len:454 (+),score=116.97 TRINITY_DN121244_c0_g1_i1:115-1476(+)
MAKDAGYPAACCRCMFPLFAKTASFPAVKLTDEERNEENQHLLQDVLDSDDEQADTLSADQIERYLHETRARGRRAEVETRNGDGLRNRGTADRKRGSASGSSSRSPDRGKPSSHALREVDDGSSRRSGELFDGEEDDELFDEEDELENVVVGAKSARGEAMMRSGGSSSSSSRPPQSTRPEQQSLMDAELPEVDDKRGLLPVAGDAGRAPDMISMNDWIDMDEQEPRELLAIPPQGPLTATSWHIGDDDDGGFLSDASLHGFGQAPESLAEERDLASSRERSAAQAAMEVLNMMPPSGSFAASFSPDKPLVSSGGDKLSVSSVSTGISEAGHGGGAAANGAAGGGSLSTAAGSSSGNRDEDSIDDDDILPMTAFGGAFAALNLQPSHGSAMLADSNTVAFGVGAGAASPALESAGEHRVGASNGGGGLISSAQLEGKAGGPVYFSLDDDDDI